MKLHELLAKVFRTRDIIKPVGGVPTLYLRRFYLLRTRWFNLFLHYIAMSDDDRFCHDHPWDFWTFILKNGYLEEIRAPLHHGHEVNQFDTNLCARCGARRDGKGALLGSWNEPCERPRWMVTLERQRALSLLFRDAEHTHRVHITAGKPAWTLVLTRGHARRMWGFQTDMGWVDWRTYLNLPFADDHVEDIID